MRNYERFICPKCGEALHREGGSLYCPAGHCYDIAKSGYVNLADMGKGKVTSGDSKEMTEARHRIMELGYYKHLLFSVKELLVDMDEHFDFILDCGCGEGTFAKQLTKSFGNTDIFGVDLSKTAINIASKSVPDATFAIANSSALPFRSGSADVVLCAFTPIFPAEIKRLLRLHGVLVTVTPGEDHLWELKEKLYEKPYKNEEFDFEYEGFDEVCTQRSICDFTVTGEDVRSLLQMTPYYYKTSPEAIERVCAMPSLTTRLSFKIGIYEKISE